MASYTDQQLLGAVQRQLQPGENVVSVAFGHKPMPVGLTIICVLGILAAIIPGLILFLILNAVLTKNYVVALTNLRLIVNEVSGSLQMKSTMDFPLPLQGRLTATPKGNFIEFALFGQRTVEMKFFRNNGPTNYNNAQMIVQSLQQGQMGGPAGAGDPGAYGMPQMGGGAPGGQLPPGGGYGPPPGGGYGPPPGGGAPPGGGYGPPGGGYGPPGGGAPPGGGYGPPPGGGAPPGGGYGPPPGGGYGPPPGGGYGPPGGGYGPS